MELDKELLKIDQLWKWARSHQWELEQEFSRKDRLHFVVQLRNKLKAISPNLRLDYAYNPDPLRFFLAITSTQPDADQELLLLINSNFPDINRRDNRLWARYLQLRSERIGPDYELDFESFCRRICQIRYRVDKVVKETRQMSIILFLPNYKFHLDKDYSMQVGKDLIALMLGDSNMKDGVALTSTGPLPKEQEELFYLIDLAQHADYLRPL